MNKERLRTSKKPERKSIEDKVAEHFIEEASTELENIEKAKAMNTDKLIDFQNKTIMGLKGKAELALDLEAINICIADI